MPSSLRSIPTLVFGAWLLASAVSGGVNVGLALSRLPVSGTFLTTVTAALGLCLLAAPIIWLRMIRKADASRPGRHSSLDSPDRLNELIDSLPAIVARFDGEQRCVFANQRALEALGLAEAVGRHLSEALSAEAYEPYVLHIPIVMGGHRTAFEGSDLRDGEPVHFLVTLIPEFDTHKAVIGFFLMTSDITAVKHAQSEVRRSEARLRAITDNLPVMICSIDCRGLLQFANHTFEVQTGVAAEGAVGRPFRDLIGETSFLQAEASIKSALLGTRSQFEIATDQDGACRYWQGLCVPGIDAHGVATCVYALLTDITTVRKSELNMAQLAHTDALTGLPNRRHLDEQLPETLAHAHRLKQGIALLFLDVDHFKDINDRHGHAVGDAVLAEFAQRLRIAVRSSDCVARYAGDEFVVILEGVGARHYGERVASEIVQKMREPILVGRLMLTVTTSIGVVYLSPGGTIEAQGLLDAADHALYQAKAQGRNGFSTCEVCSSVGVAGVSEPVALGITGDCGAFGAAVKCA